jgi:D-xylose transport system substrate-binding protein
MSRHSLFLITMLLPVLGATIASAQTKVFMLLPNTTTTRFESRDAPLFVAAMKKASPQAEVIVQNAEGDPMRQQRLVEDAISQAASAIVLVASDSNLAAGSLNAAAGANVPVVLYDHDAVGGKADAHVVFDSLAVGQQQGKRAAELINGMDKDLVRVALVKGQQGEYGTGQYEKGQRAFLDPLIEAGKAEIVCEQYTQNWDPVLAQNFAEDCLTRTGGDVDMFITMNDGCAGGVIAALVSQSYQPGQIVVTGGQNADVEAIRYIVEGWLDNTILKDLRLQAQSAADVVSSIIAGNGVPPEMINGKVNNGFMDVPAVFLPVSNITSVNVEEVVTAGIWSWDQICQGATSAPACQAQR